MLIFLVIKMLTFVLLIFVSCYIQNKEICKLFITTAYFNPKNDKVDFDMAATILYLM